MKKKIIAFILLCFTSTGFISFKCYGVKKANDYARFFSDISKKPHNLFDVNDDVKVKKILKQTPNKLIILIQWGDKQRAYISIDNWMTRAHDYIEFDVVDKEKSRVVYE